MGDNFGAKDTDEGCDNEANDEDLGPLKRMDNPDAARAVLSYAQLLAVILISLTESDKTVSETNGDKPRIRSVSIFQRVNNFWREAVEGSSTLQKLLHFIPATYG
jgi:hypothetical protein